MTVEDGVDEKGDNEREILKTGLKEEKEREKERRKRAVTVEEKMGKYGEEKREAKSDESSEKKLVER